MRLVCTPSMWMGSIEVFTRLRWCHSKWRSAPIDVGHFAFMCIRAFVVRLAFASKSLLVRHRCHYNGAQVQASVTICLPVCTCMLSLRLSSVEMADTINDLLNGHSGLCCCTA